MGHPSSGWPTALLTFNNIKKNCLDKKLNIVYPFDYKLVIKKNYVVFFLIFIFKFIKISEF